MGGGMTVATEMLRKTIIILARIKNFILMVITVSFSDLEFGRFIRTQRQRWRFCGVVANVQECDIQVSEFKL